MRRVGAGRLGVARTDYDQRFFRSLTAGADASARVVLPIVLAAVRPRSIIDVGCGGGGWLAVAADLGVADYQGVDGAQAVAALKIPSDHFSPIDLEDPGTPARRYDIALCLEVVEHLSPAAGDRVVAFLADCAETVRTARRRSCSRRRFPASAASGTSMSSGPTTGRLASGTAAWSLWTW